jgi:hypothetical protein
MAKLIGFILEFREHLLTQRLSGLESVGLEHDVHADEFLPLADPVALLKMHGHDPPADLGSDQGGFLEIDRAHELLFSADRAGRGLRDNDRSRRLARSLGGQQAGRQTKEEREDQEKGNLVIRRLHVEDVLIPVP